MKTYIITIPAFSREIKAINKKEALEIFAYDYDQAQHDIEFNQPIIRAVKNPRKEIKK